MAGSAAHAVVESRSAGKQLESVLLFRRPGDPGAPDTVPPCAAYRHHGCSPMIVTPARVEGSALRCNMASAGPGQTTVLVVPDRLLDLFVRVHHERAVLHDRLAQRASGKQDKARALARRPDLDAIAGREH